MYRTCGSPTPSPLPPFLFPSPYLFPRSIWSLQATTASHQPAQSTLMLCACKIHLLPALVPGRAPSCFTPKAYSRIARSRLSCSGRTTNKRRESKLFETESRNEVEGQKQHRPLGSVTNVVDRLRLFPCRSAGGAWGMCGWRCYRTKHLPCRVTCCDRSVDGPDGLSVDATRRALEDSKTQDAGCVRSFLAQARTYASFQASVPRSSPSARGNPNL